VTTQKDAVEALADYLSSSQGIGKMLREHNTSRAALKEVKAFAEKWSIPFSLDLMRTTTKAMDHKRWHGEVKLPRPQRKDFEKDYDFWDAMDEWRYVTHMHTWVSSSETSNC